MKIMFVTKKVNEAYDPEKHLTRLWNFLYWEGCGCATELLIVGNGNYGLENSTHKSLLICAQKNGCIPPPRIMDGAGNCENGKVSSWRSTGFEVTTPENIRTKIMSTLNATG